MVQNAV